MLLTFARGSANPMRAHAPFVSPGARLANGLDQGTAHTRAQGKTRPPGTNSRRGQVGPDTHEAGDSQAGGVGQRSATQRQRVAGTQVTFLEVS